jgi:predicted nucleic acid-binding protein
LNVVLDASSSINLHRSGLLEVVLTLSSFGYVFYIGSIVKDECGDLQEFLRTQEAKGTLIILPDDTLNPQEFTDVLNRYDLGLGETECIALAKQQEFCVCTDDKAARRAAAKHFAEDRVLGSLRLIRECVCQGLLTAPDAFLAYEVMIARGAFLPCISAAYFDC